MGGSPRDEACRHPFVRQAWEMRRSLAMAAQVALAPLLTGLGGSSRAEGVQLEARQGSVQGRSNNKNSRSCLQDQSGSEVGPVQPNKGAKR